MGIYKEYPTFGINIDDIDDLIKIIKPQASIDFSSLNGNLPAVSNGSKSLDPCELVDVGPYIENGANGTVSNGRFGSSLNSMGFVFAGAGVVGSGFYMRTSILPSSSWSITLSASDPYSAVGGYYLTLDSSNNTMSVGKINVDPEQEQIESLIITKVDSAKANSPRELVFQWDGVRRFRATFGSSVITAVNDEYSIDQHVFGVIVSGNILNSIEVGASEYFDNLDPNGPDRGVGLANISLSNPNVAWPGDDDGASLLSISDIAAQESIVSSFITIDSAGPFFLDQFPGDIQPGEIRVGLAGYPDQNIVQKYESENVLGINVHTILGTPSSTPMYELPLIEDIYDMAVDDITFSRIPTFSLLVEDITDLAQLESDFDEIISILDSLESYSWLTIVPISEENLSDLADWIAAQTLFKERLDFSESLKIAFFPSVNIKIIEDFENVLIGNAGIEDTWDFIGVYSIIENFDEAYENNEIDLTVDWSVPFGTIVSRGKKMLFIDSFTPNISTNTADYIDYKYNSLLSSSEPQFIGYIYADNVYELAKVNYEDTLTGVVPLPEDYPAPPNGALQYIDYNVDNSTITDISVDFRINSLMNAEEATYFQFYDSDIGIDHQYFGVQTDAPLDSSLQLLIFSKFIGGASPVREAQYNEIRTVDVNAYKVVSDAEGDYASLRCTAEISVGEWHNVRIERAEAEDVLIDSVSVSGYWFDYYFDDNLIGGLWFEKDLSEQVYFSGEGTTFTEFWLNNNDIELLPVPEQEYWIKPIKFNNSYDYTTVTSVYSAMPNSDTTYIASETPYDGYLRLRFGGDTPRAHDNNEVIDVTVAPTMVNSPAINKWIEIMNQQESVDSTQGTTLGTYEAPYGEAADDFAQIISDFVLPTYLSDIIIWRDMIGMDTIEKYLELYQAIISKVGYSYRYYGPNIDISSRNNPLYDLSFQFDDDVLITVDSRYFNFLEEFIDEIESGATPVYNDGIAFSGNFTDEEWPYIINYFKGRTNKRLVITRIDNEENKDDADSENAKIAVLVDVLEDSDTVFLPGYPNSLFSIPDPAYAGYTWVFSATLDIPAPGALNPKIKFPAYSEEILGIPSFTISNEDSSVYITETVPPSGGFISLENLLEDTYTITIFGDTLQSGGASLRMTFSADNLDEISISDSIYLEY